MLEPTQINGSIDGVITEPNLGFCFFLVGVIKVCTFGDANAMQAVEMYFNLFFQILSYCAATYAVQNRIAQTACMLVYSGSLTGFDY